MKFTEIEMDDGGSPFEITKRHDGQYNVWRNFLVDDGGDISYLRWVLVKVCQTKDYAKRYVALKTGNKGH